LSSEARNFTFRPIRWQGMRSSRAQRSRVTGWISKSRAARAGVRSDSKSGGLSSRSPPGNGRFQLRYPKNPPSAAIAGPDGIGTGNALASEGQKERAFDRQKLSGCICRDERLCIGFRLSAGHGTTPENGRGPSGPRWLCSFLPATGRRWTDRQTYLPRRRSWGRHPATCRWSYPHER
jgi:hypothetical protein